MNSANPDLEEKQTQEEQNQPNSTQKEFVDYVKANCSQIAPSLEDSLQNHQDLAEIGNKLHSVLESAQTAPIQAETAQSIDLVLRHIISSIAESKHNESVAELSTMFAQRPSDVNIERLKLIELQRENATLKSNNAEKAQEIQLAHKETDAANDRNAQLQKEKDAMEAKFNEEISKLKSQISSLQEELTGQTDKDHKMSDSVASMEKRLRDAEAETENVKRQLEEAVNRLKLKNDYINKLQAKIQLSKSEYEQLKVEKSQSEMTLSQQIKMQSMDSESKTKNLIIKLTNHIHDQDKQIQSIIQANHNAALIIERQNQLIDEYDAQASTFQMHLNDADGEIENLQNELEEVTTMKDSTQNILDSRTEELANLRNVVAQCIENAAPKWSITEDGLPGLIRELTATKIDPETAKNLQDLTAMVDSLSRFIVELIRNNHADINILRNIQRPVLTDGTLRLDILNEMAKVRSLLKDITYSSAEEDPLCAYLCGVDENFQLKNTPDAAASAVLACICAKLREFTQKEFDELRKVKQVLPFVCLDNELPTAVTQYILELQPVFKQLLDVIGKTLNFHGSTADIFQCLCKYIEETSNMLNDLDTGVRPLIGYAGKIVGIPAVIKQALTELREDLNLHRNGVSKEIMNAKLEQEKEKASWRRKIQELEGQLEKNGEVIADLHKQIDELAAKLKKEQQGGRDATQQAKVVARDLESQKEANKVLESSRDMAIKERDAMEATMKERQEKFEERLTAVLEHERKINQEEKDRLEKRLREEITSLSNELGMARSKIKKEQGKVRRITDMYNDLQDQRSTERNQTEAEKSTLILALSDSDKQARKMKALRTKLEEERQKNVELQKELKKHQNAANQQSSFAQQLRSTLSGSPSPTASPTRYSEPASPTSPRTRSIDGLHMSPTKSSPQKNNSTQLSSQPNTVLMNQNLSQTAIMRQRHEVENFVAELGEILTTFIGKDIRWNRQRVIKTVEALIAKVESMDNEREELRQSRFAQMNHEWQEWADQILLRKSPGYKGGATETEMRTRLNDLICLVSPRSISAIDSLRAQKELLIKQNSENQQQQQPQENNNNEEEENHEKTTERSVEEEEKKDNATTLVRLLRVALFIAATTKKPQKPVVAQTEPGTNVTKISFM